MGDQSRDGMSITPVNGPVRWESYITSAIGADHVRAGKPNEDAVGAERFEFGDGAGIQVLAVADGHGHMRHFRSDRGSTLAVTAAMATVRSWADARSGRDRLTSQSASVLVSDLVTRWRHLVADDLRADPLSREALASLPPEDPPEIPYGATLLLAVLTADVAVLAQIGDGEMLLILPDGRHLEPVPTDSRLDGTRTTSLCQPDAVSAFRVGLVNLAKTPAYAVFAATDGYGNAQADVSWQQVFAADLVRLGIQHGTSWIGGQLADWAAACASSDGSGDDTTAALALNPAAALTAPRRRLPSRDSGAERTTQLRAAPVSLVSDADKTLIWPGRPAEPTLPVADPITATAPVPLAAAPIPASAPPTSAPPTRVPPVPATSAPATSVPASRLWLALAVGIAIVVAVAVYFLTRGSGGSRQPSLRPTPTASVPKSGHSTGASTGGQRRPKPTSSGLPGGLPRGVPTSVPSGLPGQEAGGGAGDLVRAGGRARLARGGHQNV